MAKLTIGNQTVTVGDEFLRMSPEQQQATVDEIAASIGVSAPQEDPLAAASRMSQFGPGTDTAAPALPVQQPGRPDILGSTAATLGGIVNSIPILGPMSQAVSDNLVGVGAQLTGGDYEEARNAAIKRRQELAAANPIANIAGNVGGAIGSFGALGATQQGAQALGMTGPTVQRIVNSGLSTLGLTTADNMVRGQAPTEALGNAVLPTGIAAAIPAVGAGTRAVAQAVGERVAPIMQSVTDPVSEAARRVGVAVTRDVAANPQAVMSAADEAVARQSGLPLVNIDRGGETTRALARSVANQSPEARAAIQRTVEDRFTTQAPRAIDFIKRLVGGNVDDIAFQSGLQQAARRANDPAYKAAYNAPQARAVWTPEIRNLMQADPFRTAIQQAESTAKNAAAVTGGKSVINPFVFLDDGSVTLRTMPDGSRALPNLQFWDVVQRNLRRQSEVAARQGDNLLASQIGDMRRQLNMALDTAVPQFQQARQGAAMFFGAEDALDAGKVFANQPRAIPEARQAYNAFNEAEKQAFATGYASEIIDKVKAASDRRNIIQQMFGSPAAREMNELVFGRAKAQQLEAFVKVEALADQLRGAMGNSTTARQLMELGIGGGAGFALSGDWMGALTGAALAKGGRYLGEKVDAKVMQEVAKLLTTDNPQALQKAVYNASLSPKWMAALDQLSDMLAPVSRGLAQQTSGNEVTNNNAQPLRITVNGAGSYGN
jgi:hypothetical protein